jgi:16S rRNA (guanine(966)-N(2))-methyltransferase RsmD
MAKPLKTSAPVRANHEIRIIGGAWRRTRIAVRDLPGLRPTPDRVRETLFNWLGQDLSGWRCLDVFAGTGVLGLEAASRGAADVVLVEQDRTLVEAIAATLLRLKAQGVRVVRGDGVATLRQSAPSSLELVFVDPPFDAMLFEPALRAAAAAVAPSGWVYLEAPLAWTDASLAPFGLCVHRHLKAGAVHAHLLRRADPAHA